MSSTLFSATRPVNAVTFERGYSGTRTLPTGAIVEMDGSTADHERFVRIVHEGQKLLISADDMQAFQDVSKATSHRGRHRT